MDSDQTICLYCQGGFLLNISATVLIAVSLKQTLSADKYWMAEKLN